MKTTFNTAASAPGTPAASGSGNGGTILLWLAAIGLAAWGIYEFVVKPRVQEAKDAEKKAAETKTENASNS